MRRKKSKARNTEISYWEAMADNMTALLLAILLVLMLLVMYLVNVPEEVLIDDKLGETTGRYMYQGEDGEDRGFRTDYEDGEEGATGRGGGGEQGGGRNDNDNTEIDPDIGDGEEDTGNKSAVQVQIVDEETGNTVKIPDITFELYHGAGMMTLCTYYPSRIEYKKYKTQKDGTFFCQKSWKCIPYSRCDLSQRWMATIYQKGRILWSLRAVIGMSRLLS